MASKAAIVLSLNILFFTLVSSTYVPCPPPATPKHTSPPTPKHSPPPTPKQSPPPTPKHSPPPTPKQSPPPTPKHSPPPTPINSPPPTPINSPAPKAPSTNPADPKKQPSCPKDTLKFGVCADVLGLVNVQLGKSSKDACCSLIDGLSNLDAAVCLCTALKANVLGINLNVPINLSLILNYCGKDVPKGFECA
ncbi:hypothetical protein TanjilG_32223 [Lupinus angustifolius]|uniref:Bifunctional inhibitor/plant lipid transfer protein/seed storage helical domain-containing protein n=1 Tax=Lupinus angustifolius TaxID=3871 RepID=A0A394CH77_LUPAN|nr:PREDICTED: lipid transfer protein EARLI 1-like [Lupinus angustifolius]XP_019446708.1 PREDICTED: lipid transfer protein EARLI 1-like [Lupinus angustifolius]OIW09783.1 hypothetical protein TanjilG_32221 [Lupinus angustifolius]OIW09785.1 hypothetical protein TanjilG_32223 [Lupinus angustifolius]